MDQRDKGKSLCGTHLTWSTAGRPLGSAADTGTSRADTTDATNTTDKARAGEKAIIRTPFPLHVNVLRPKLLQVACR
jgi:hypothetical protein